MIVLTVVFACLLGVSVSAHFFQNRQVADLQKRLVESEKRNEESRRESSTKSVLLEQARADLSTLALENGKVRSERQRWEQLSSELERLARQEAKECGEKDGRLELYEEVIELQYAEIQSLANKLAAERSAKAQVKALQECLGRIAAALGRIRGPV